LGLFDQALGGQETVMETTSITAGRQDRQTAASQSTKLERPAAFDTLTGLYNDQTILGKLHELASPASCYRDDFSVVLLDIDHFKSVNELHGQLTGDKVLMKIAALIRDNTRSTDIPGRYGGAEFMIIFPKTSLASSWAAAERLRSAIEKTEFRGSARNIFAVTVSQGLVGWELNDDTASLISRADEALHKAQQKGRNRIQILLGPSLRDKV
jgi:diguanylate cyclase (GGDEF)-like protein